MEELTISGKKYIKAKAASRELKYSPDYIGQLCRSGKISAKLVGRSWYVDLAELKHHKKVPYGSKGTKFVSARNTKTADLIKPEISKSEEVQVSKPKVQENHYEKRVLWNAPKYDSDDNDLVPSIGGRQDSSSGGVKITVVPTDASKLEVNATPGASYQLNPTELPEVSLKGTLKIKPVEDEYSHTEEAVAEQIPKVVSAREKRPALIRKVLPKRISFEERLEAKIGNSRPEKITHKKPAEARKVKPVHKEIPVNLSPENTRTDEIPIKIKLFPYILTAFILALVTLSLLFGLNGVVSTSELSTRQSLDFNPANLQAVTSWFVSSE